MDLLVGEVRLGPMYRRFTAAMNLFQRFGPIRVRDDQPGVRILGRNWGIGPVASFRVRQRSPWRFMWPRLGFSLDRGAVNPGAERLFFLRFARVRVVAPRALCRTAGRAVTIPYAFWRGCSGRVGLGKGVDGGPYDSTRAIMKNPTSVGLQILEGFTYSRRIVVDKRPDLRIWAGFNGREQFPDEVELEG
jgi:hypothetical protein